MFINSIKDLLRNHLKDPLKYLELTFLVLMLLSLPTFEAPKNLFLAGYIVIALFRQFQKNDRTPWGHWDWIFLGYIGSALLSAFFAGISPGYEWRGFRGILFWTAFGWIISRSVYKENEIKWIVWITILSALPPLIWGLFQYMLIHTKDNLELNSVGHVNHSAIYLGIILGASLSVSLSTWNKQKLLQRVALIFLPVFFFVSIIIGQSRGVFSISLIRISLIILLIPNLKKIKVFAFLILGMILLLMPYMHAKIIEKNTNDLKNNKFLTGRQLVWNVSLEAARFHPFLGIGNGNWHLIKLDDLEKSVRSRGVIFKGDNYALQHKHSHNLYLTALVERGIVGLGILITLLGMWLVSLIKNYPLFKKTSQGSYVWGASLSAWIVTSGVGFVNSTFHHEHAILALLFLGLYLNKLSTLKKC